jgi:AP endonuclease-2
VATFCRNAYLPTKSEEGLAGTLPSSSNDDSVGCYDGISQEFTQSELKELDAEGRCIITLHDLKVGNERKTMALINVYCPRADPEKPERLLYKLRFYKLLELRANSLVRSGGHFVVIVGDINTSHRKIDHCDPYEEFEDNPARRWFDHFLYYPKSDVSVIKKDDDDDFSQEEWKILKVDNDVEGHQYLDSFRHFNPDRELAFTCWNTLKNCRSTNYGTRLDYVFTCKSMADYVTNCDIEQDVLGSDHCPVRATYANISGLASSKLSSYCTKNFLEFSGSQQKLSNYFTAKSEKRKLKEAYEDCLELLPSIKVPKKAGAQQSNISSFFIKQKPLEHNKTASSAVHTIIKEPLNESSEIIDVDKRIQTASAWKSMMKGPPTAPMCKGHNEVSVLRTVKKKGPNCGRQFWCCPRGEGKFDDPNARCNFFKWIK